MPDEKQPIIIKKKKGEEAHGGSHGAWKVAYADFMTAMMAFFLLMWLLSIASDEQKAGIASYFAPVDNVVKLDATNSILQQQQKKEGWDILNLNRATYDIVKEQVNKILDEDNDLAEFKDNIMVEKTPEGILINITGKNNKEIFEKGTSVLTPTGSKLIKYLANLLQKLNAKMKIYGHTDSTPFWGKTGFGNWELSANRANTVRRLLGTFGVPDDNFNGVIGMSDKKPLIKEKPLDPVNRRAAILIEEK